MAPHYQLAELAATMAAPISGRYLAYNRHDRVAHAFFAGDLVLGKTRLVKPTVTQAAFLVGVNRAYVHWAIKRQAERPEIEAGPHPLGARLRCRRQTAACCRRRARSPTAI